MKLAAIAVLVLALATLLITKPWTTHSAQQSARKARKTPAAEVEMISREQEKQVIEFITLSEMPAFTGGKFVDPWGNSDPRSRIMPSCVLYLCSKFQKMERSEASRQIREQIKQNLESRIDKCCVLASCLGFFDNDSAAVLDESIVVLKAWYRHPSNSFMKEHIYQTPTGMLAYHLTSGERGKLAITKAVALLRDPDLYTRRAGMAIVHTAMDSLQDQKATNNEIISSITRDDLQPTQAAEVIRPNLFIVALRPLPIEQQFRMLDWLAMTGRLSTSSEQNAKLILKGLNISGGNEVQRVQAIALKAAEESERRALRLLR